MKKLTFQLSARKKLEVNGEVFEILKNDTEVITEAGKVEKKLRRLIAGVDESERDSDESLEILEYLTNSVDGMLGDGALMKITGGRMPSMAESIELYRLLTGAIVEIYEKDLTAKYE